MRALALALATALAVVSAGCGLGLDRLGDSSAGSAPVGCDENDDLVVVPSDAIEFGSVSAWGDAVEEKLTLGPQPDASRLVVVAEVALDPDFSQAFDLAFEDAATTPVRIQPSNHAQLMVSFPGRDYLDTGNTGSFTGQLNISYEIDAEGSTCDVTRELSGTICADNDHDGDCG